MGYGEVINHLLPGTLVVDRKLSSTCQVRIWGPHFFLRDMCQSCPPVMWFFRENTMKTPFPPSPWPPVYRKDPKGRPPSFFDGGNDFQGLILLDMIFKSRIWTIWSGCGLRGFVNRNDENKHRYKTLVFHLTPWKINGWNLKSSPGLKRKIIWTKPPFVGSMLIFRGVLVISFAFNLHFYLHICIFWISMALSIST